MGQLNSSKEGKGVGVREEGAVWVLTSQAEVSPATTGENENLCFSPWVCVCECVCVHACMVMWPSSLTT